MRVSLAGVVRSFGARTVLDRVDLTLGPRSRLGLVGPNGAGKSTLLRLAAGIDEPDAGTRRADARDADGRLPAAGARPPARRDADRLSRAAHRRRRRRGGGRAAHRGVEPGRVRRSTGAVPRARRRRSRGQGADGLRRARPAGVARAGDRHALGRRGRARRARRDSAVAVRPAAPRRADERPRLRRPRPAGALPRRLRGRDRGRLARPSVPRPHGDTDRRDRPLDGRAARVRRRLERLRAARELAPQKQYDEFEHAQDRRREVEALLHARRNQARAGGGFLAKMTGGSDRRGTKALPGRCGRRRGRWSGWSESTSRTSHGSCTSRSAAAQRPGDHVASLEDAVAERGTSGSARSTSTSRPGSASRSPAGTAAASRRCSRSCSASCRSPPAHGTVGRATVIAALDQRRTAYDGDEPLLATFTARTGLRPVERAYAPRQVQPRRGARRAACTTLSPGERTRAELAELRPAASTARARRADEPPRPGGDRGARDGARGLRRHARRRLPRPPFPRGRRANESQYDL